MKKLLILPVAASLFAVSSLNAATLMTFDTKIPDTAEDDTSVLAGAGGSGSGILDSNLESSSLVFGAGMVSNAAAGQFVDVGIEGTTIAGSITNNDYLSFTVDAKDGFAASLNSITLRMSFQNGSSDYAWGLFSSATGFAAGNQLDGATGVAGSSDVVLETVDLSGVSALQNVTSQIEFRLVLAAPNQYVYAGVKDDSIADWPNPPAISVDGTVAVVPEPSSAMLLGLAGVASIFWRRKR